MDAHLFRLNQMSYQQNTQTRTNRSHYSNRQQPVEQARVQKQTAQNNISSAGSSGSENDELNQQLSNVSTVTNRTNLSQQTMLAHNGKLTSQQQQHLAAQQHHMQQQHKQRSQQQAGNQHRQAALQAHSLAVPGDPKNGGYLKSNPVAAAVADNMTTSSSDHTIDDLHHLAHSYGQHRLTGSRYSGDGSGASNSSQSGGRFLLGILFTLAELLLFTTVLLWLYWSYQHDDGFAWQNDRKQQFNTHAALMLFGFIFLNGQAMLIYRSFQCCSKIYTKILHTILFVLATSAISLGLILGYTAQDNIGLSNKPIMHFYSLHAWIGLSTVGLFVFQFVFGFVSFLILLCCDTATSKFRAALLPIHKTFGLIIFSLAIATCLTGLLQTARSRLR